MSTHGQFCPVAMGAAAGLSWMYAGIHYRFHILLAALR